MNRKISHLFAAISLALAVFFVSAVAVADVPTFEQNPIVVEPAPIPQAVLEASKAVYQMIGDSEDADGNVFQNSCSVVFFAPERAFTAAHCTDMKSPVVLIGPFAYPVTFAYINPSNDMAIIIVPKVTNVPMVGQGTRATKGQDVYNVGFAWGEEKQINEGFVISDPEKLNYGFRDLEIEVVFTSAAAFPGMSGGAVFNEKGEMVGILVAGAFLTGVPSAYVLIPLM